MQQARLRLQGSQEMGSCAGAHKLVQTVVQYCSTGTEGEGVLTAYQFKAAGTCTSVKLKLPEQNRLRSYLLSQATTHLLKSL